MQTEALTQGARASLELQLQDARRDRDDLIARRNDLMAEADVQHALSCEGGANSFRHTARAAGKRLDAFQMDPDLAAAKLRVANLESQLKSAPAQVAPVVPPAEAVAGMDDTHNFRAVPA